MDNEAGSGDINTDSEENMQDIIQKLSVTQVSADTTHGEGEDTDSQHSNQSGRRHDSETASVGARSNSSTASGDRQSGSEAGVENGNQPSGFTEEASQMEASDTKAKDGKRFGGLKLKNPFKIIKKQISGHLAKDKEREREIAAAERLSQIDEVLQEVTIEGLPQVFVTKYLGQRKCDGLWGIKSTRGPVEEMISQIKAMPEDEELPLVQLRVSKNGIHIRQHSANKCTTQTVDKELVPIEFISYGVQDIKYTRVFSFILVREMSSRDKKLECHAYICDSTITARKLAVSLSAAFREYAQGLEGKPYKFQVDLRPTKEIEEDLETPDRDGDIEV